MKTRTDRIRFALPVAVMIAAVAAVAAVAAFVTPGDAPPAAAEPEPVTYELTITQPPSGGVLDHFPKRAAYTEYERVVIRARVNAGHELTGWGGDCAHVAASTTWCILMMDGDKTVSGTFGRIGAPPTTTPTPTPTPTPTVTVKATYTLALATATNGALTASPDETSYEEGATVVVTATPRAGYRLTAWGGDCSGTAATSATCTLTMDADKTVSATFAAISPSAAPTLIAVTTGKAGEVLLEWRIDPAPAGLTGWQYRWLEVNEGVRGAWSAWTNVPGATAATRSHRVTGLRDRYHWFEVRAVAGSRTGRGSAGAEGAPAYMGADGIPAMLPGDIIEGGQTWRIHAGPTVIDVPAGTRLVTHGVALDSGRVIVSFSDLETGASQVVDIGRAEGVGRYPPDPARAGGEAPASAGTARDVDAIFDQILASARLVPAK